MWSVQFQKVKCVAQLTEFHRKFCAKISYQIPINYFKNGACYALTLHNKIVAGFCLVHRPANELRSLQQVPYFSNVLYKDEFIFNVAEFTGYFIDSKAYSFRFTLNLVKIIMLAKAKYFVYSYPVDHRGLEKYYSSGKPIRIYTGKGKRLAGHPEDQKAEHVEILTKWGIVRIFLYRTKRWLRFSQK